MAITELAHDAPRTVGNLEIVALIGLSGEEAVSFLVFIEELLGEALQPLLVLVAQCAEHFGVTLNVQVVLHRSELVDHVPEQHLVEGHVVIDAEHRARAEKTDVIKPLADRLNRRIGRQLSQVEAWAHHSSVKLHLLVMVEHFFHSDLLLYLFIELIEVQRVEIELVKALQLHRVHVHGRRRHRRVARLHHFY